MPRDNTAAARCFLMTAARRRDFVAAAALSPADAIATSHTYALMYFLMLPRARYFAKRFAAVIFTAAMRPFTSPAPPFSRRLYFTPTTRLSFEAPLISPRRLGLLRLIIYWQDFAISLISTSSSAVIKAMPTIYDNFPRRFHCCSVGMQLCDCAPIFRYF